MTGDHCPFASFLVHHTPVWDKADVRFLASRGFDRGFRCVQTGFIKRRLCDRLFYGHIFTLHVMAFRPFCFFVPACSINPFATSSFLLPVTWLISQYSQLFISRSVGGPNRPDMNLMQFGQVRHVNYFQKQEHKAHQFLNSQKII